MKFYYKNNGLVHGMFHALRTMFGRHNRPTESRILATMNRFRTNLTLMAFAHHQRRVVVKLLLDSIERSIVENPNESTSNFMEDFVEGFWLEACKIHSSGNVRRMVINRVAYSVNEPKT